MARTRIVPKRVGTVKIPKRMRKFGNRALANAMMRELAAGALVAIGTGLAARGV